MDHGGRSQKNREIPSILRRESIRELLGICWYSDESVDSTNQGGTAVFMCIYRP